MYVIRAGRREDVAGLNRIERAADRIIADRGHAAFRDAAALEQADLLLGVKRGHLAVAEIDGSVVGFAYLDRLGRELSLRQISVDPVHGRAGVGTALLRHVMDSCVEPSILLDCQTDVPWHIRWYERFGFVAVDPDAWSPAMRSVAAEQAAAGFDWSTRTFMRRSLAPLSAGLSHAMRLAWESFAAGSLGIGAVARRPDGTTVATGRNRIFEADPGDDVLANTSLAHAELNVLAKLKPGQNRDHGLVLSTTLEPCLQCLGAIRLSDIEIVDVLAPDPLWTGVHGVRHLNAFVNRRWPDIRFRPIDNWSALSILLPTFVGVFWNAAPPGWAELLPQATELSRQLVESGELMTATKSGFTIEQVAAQVWSRLGGLHEELSAER
jgi:tRNA(Arg) A34 adenosine deaminase TadA/N-acetylglutamate synthase-like GNAT family acetyltransferase